MTDIVWGDPIRVDGKRPIWLRDDDVFTSATQDERRCKPHGTAWSTWSVIRLPADHFAYLAIAKSFEPWGGGDAAPADWDQKARPNALWRNGVTMAHTNPRWYRQGNSTDIIGYRKKDPATELPPMWAIKRAAEECGTVDDVTPVAFHHFARYIAQHEEPPVDPLVQAFDEIHGYQLSEGETWSQSIADRLRACLGKYGLEIREIG